MANQVSYPLKKVNPVLGSRNKKLRKISQKKYKN